MMFFLLFFCHTAGNLNRFPQPTPSFPLPSPPLSSPRPRKYKVNVATSVQPQRLTLTFTLINSLPRRVCVEAAWRKVMKRTHEIMNAKTPEKKSKKHGKKKQKSKKEHDGEGTSESKWETVMYVSEEERLKRARRKILTEKN